MNNNTISGSGIDVFSNMAEFNIEIDGRVWPSTEHYYQAMKFIDPDLQETIRLASSPFRAAALGNNRKWKIREGWDMIRVSIMEKAMMAKFTQHKELAKILLSTGDKNLIDHSAADGFWGEGIDGSGQNMNGKILMKIRCMLTNH